MGKESKADLGEFVAFSFFLIFFILPVLEKGKGCQMAGRWGKINALWAV